MSRQAAVTQLRGGWGAIQIVLPQKTRCFEIATLPGPVAVYSFRGSVRPSQEILGACHTLPTHLVMSSELVLTKETIMTPRLNPFAAALAPMQSWLDLGNCILRSSLEERLME